MIRKVSSQCQCVVPENIHTPTTEGFGNSGGVAGSKAQENPEERGVERINYFPESPEGQLRFIPM